MKFTLKLTSMLVIRFSLFCCLFFSSVFFIWNNDFPPTWKSNLNCQFPSIYLWHIKPMITIPNIDMQIFLASLKVIIQNTSVCIKLHIFSKSSDSYSNDMYAVYKFYQTALLLRISTSLTPAVKVLLWSKIIWYSFIWYVFLFLWISNFTLSSHVIELLVSVH